ncbi:MAG: tRNA glutamyl-Q(34) synthetase GluQRS [Betaproteobacteria bacterium]
MNSPAPLASGARYRGRFAPSPTGPLHFGSLIAALGSYLEARAHHGDWLVRIEDVDVPRIVPGAADQILRALDACGLHWDGAIVRQSLRTDAYHAAVHVLKQRGMIYPCACSRREIADSAIAGIEGLIYPGTCRAAVPSDKKPRALRVRTVAAPIRFADALQGTLSQNVEAAVGDFVLYRADGVHAYQLAVVVDDAEQGVTDVVRGADLLDSTPRQIHIQNLLALPQPRYLHLPIAVNASGEKLSKQTQAAPIDCARPAPALTMALRFLGHEPPDRLAGGNASDVLQWALANWRTERVPRARHLPAPP